MEFQNELLDLLNDLSKAIVGDWVVYGGLMLGLHRDGKPLHWDNDIDILLFDDAYIDFNLLPESVSHQKYYMNNKVYRKNKKIFKPKHDWIEYMSYIRMKPENKGKNRCEIMRIASNTYSNEYIKPEFTEVFIDVETVKLDFDRYTPKYWDRCYFLQKEINSILYKEYNGMSIPLPNDLDTVCERHYGTDWTTPNPKWKY